MFEDCASSLGLNLRKSVSEIEKNWICQEVTQYYYVKGNYIREGFADLKIGPVCK